MRAVIVPLVIAVLAFLAYCIWQFRAAWERKRQEDREAQRERDKWTDDILREDGSDG